MQQRSQQPYRGQGGPKRGGFDSQSPKKPRTGAQTKGPVQLITNNFKIKSQNHGIIYTYKVDFLEGGPAESKGNLGGGDPSQHFEEEELKTNFSKLSLSENNQLETFQKFKIMNATAPQLKQIFLQYVFVGNNLFSTSQINQQVTIETTKPFFNRFYTIIIERVAEFLLDDLNSMKMEEHPIALNFINNIIKNCLRNSNLKQIGRNPRFFMPSQAKQFHGTVETWPGFFTSSWIFQRGLYLIIDNISKFLSVETCLSLINDRLKRYDQIFVNREFEGSIVMAKYGPHRTYKVNCIRWDMSPSTYFFEQGDEQNRTNMLQYFLKAYDKKILENKQPLLEIRQKRQNIYLPPELCILVGIPAKIRENKKIMADIRMSLFQQPYDRIRSIQALNKTIADSKEVREWNLDINLEPDQIEAKILPRPNIIGPGDTSISLEDTSQLRTMVIQPINFQKWAIFCLDKDVENGKYLQDKFYSLSQKNKMNIYVEFGDLVSLRNDSKTENFKEAIDQYFNDYVAPHIALQASQKKKKEASPLARDVYFFLIIIPDTLRQDHFYNSLKNKINSDSPVISQFVTSKTIEKDNDRIYLNIVRQINAKLGGDLWRMDFGKEISKKTMLVGIDVCHKGRQSIIGFCATYDPHLCKYYTQSSPQNQKGQEIISSTVLQEYFTSAFTVYREYNNNTMPDQIFIYRDGVGDSMRKQVIQFELEQLNKIVAEQYELELKKNKPPHITLIIVNKRVRQRFFEKQGTYINNPPQGTYVDQGFVEQSESIDGKFDFFLVPHSVTQGAVKPTHFYVAENTSKISKEAILNFTYALCYNYYNWNDSIKVPAPCMLADKIAIYRSEIGNIPSSVELHKLPFFL